MTDSIERQQVFLFISIVLDDVTSFNQKLNQVLSQPHSVQKTWVELLALRQETQNRLSENLHSRMNEFSALNFDGSSNVCKMTRVVLDIVKEHHGSDTEIMGTIAKIKFTKDLGVAAIKEKLGHCMWKY